MRLRNLPALLAMICVVSGVAIILHSLGWALVVAGAFFLALDRRL